MQFIPGSENKIWLAFEGKREAKPLGQVEVEFFSEISELSDEEIAEEPWILELMEVQTRLEEGSILALHEGITICQEEQIPLPTWLESELKVLIGAVARREKYGISKVGRANSAPARIRESIKVHLRKEAVRKVRRYQLMEPCLISFLFLPDGLKVKYSNQPYPDLGSTIEEAIRHAAVGLRGTFAQASEETVRKAYFSNDEEGAFWAETRPDALALLGRIGDGADKLPLGFERVETDLPTHLVQGAVDKPFDEVSVKYLEMMRSNSFQDFIALLGSGRGSEI